MLLPNLRILHCVVKELFYLIIGAHSAQSGKWVYHNSHLAIFTSHMSTSTESHAHAIIQTITSPQCSTMENKKSHTDLDLKSEEPHTIERLEDNIEYLKVSLNRIKLDSNTTQIGLLCLVILIGYLIFPYTNVYFLGVWVFMTIAWSFVNVIIVSKYGNEPEKHSINKTIKFNIAGGILHAIPLFIPELGITERCIITILYAGTSALSLNTNGAIEKLYSPYIFIILSSVAISWFLLLFNSDHVVKAILLLLIMINYVFLLKSLGKNAGTSILNELNLRKKQEQLNSQLDIALQKAEKSNESKTRFLASAGHDLRQPIHSISLFSASLAMEKLTPRAREIARHITTASETLAEELDSLLDLSKLDANMVTINKSIVSLQTQFSKLYNEFYTTAHKKGLKLEFAETNYHIHTDSISLMRILRNFIENAIKYTNKGSIFINADHINQAIQISVIDTGIGIDKARIDNIFDEFYQINNLNRDKRKGIGLGLSIVQRLTKLLGFTVNVNSEVNKGTTFTLVIPEEHIVQNTIKTNVANVHQTSTPVIAKNNHILIIDDEIQIIKGMEFLLSNYEFDISTATSYDTGLASGLRDLPDLIICDYRLDKHDGIKLISEIRAMYPHIPSFLVSGETSPDQLKKAQKHNIEILHKPVEKNLLLEQIKKYLQKTT